MVATQEQGVYVSGTRVYVSRMPKLAQWVLAQVLRGGEQEMSLTGTASQGQILKTVPTPSHTRPCSDTQQFAQAVVSLSTLFFLVLFYPPHFSCVLRSVRKPVRSPALAQRLSPKMLPKSERLDLWEQLQDQRNQLQGHCPFPAIKPVIWKKFTRCPF